VAQSRLVRDAAEARLRAAEPRLHHRLADPLRHEAVSAWLAWKALGKDEDRKLAFIWFFIQLALGVLWCYAFLWLHNPAFGLAVIMALLIALVITNVMFDRLSRIAALLLVPLALRVFYATALNFAFFMLS
jgi:translocator protein